MPDKEYMKRLGEPELTPEERAKLRLRLRDDEWWEQLKEKAEGGRKWLGWFLIMAGAIYAIRNWLIEWIMSLK